MQTRNTEENKREYDLVWFLIAVIKYYDQCNLELTGFILLKLSYHCLLLKKVRTKTQTGQGAGGTS